MAKPLNIMIAGGGIAGLTTALCLAERGHTVTVFEQADHIAEVGAGIQMSPNALRVFRALGLADPLIDRGFQPEALEMRMGRSGRQVFALPLDERSQTRWGDLYLHIHRADLIECLLRASSDHPRITIELGCPLTGYEETSDRVTLHYGVDQARHGDLLIGADGIHSAVRTQMLGPEAATFTGNVAWRAVVPTELLGEQSPPPTACVWVGPNRHAVTYRLRGGRLSNFVGVVERDDWQEESWTQRGTREGALADFEGWHSVVTTLLERADTHYRWALFDRPPLPCWSSERVVLIGDAAHPTLPFMAQGAAMAIEDGYVLARRLSDRTTPLGRALRDFHAMRIDRTTAIQTGSRTNMKTFHRGNAMSQLLTYGPMWLAGQIAPELIRRRQDPIYAHDVTVV